MHALSQRKDAIRSFDEMVGREITPIVRTSDVLVADTRCDESKMFLRNKKDYLQNCCVALTELANTCSLKRFICSCIK